MDGKITTRSAEASDRSASKAATTFMVVNFTEIGPVQEKKKDRSAARLARVARSDVNSKY